MVLAAIPMLIVMYQYMDTIDSAVPTATEKTTATATTMTMTTMVDTVYIEGINDDTERHKINFS